MNSNHLSHRRVLSVTGKDRFTFLQGLVTADILALKPGEMSFSAFLTPQGKIRTLFYVFHAQETLYLDCSTHEADSFLKHLSLFKLRADISLTLTELHVYAGGPADTPPHDAIITSPDKRAPSAGWRSLSATTPSKLGGGDQNWLERRLENGLPENEDIILGKTIALEANLDGLNAVSWSKGCYMGQEVTARSHYRGLIKRRIIPVTLQSGAFPPEGGYLSLKDSEDIPLLSRKENKALVMLRRDFWTSESISFNHIPVKVTPADWFFKIVSSESSSS
ncbi:folate-binding protein [Aristophania vespae]|uniref:Folate-binding protein n=1 Tax=Aristophania vespae TaxID=2697033 RepID=A0A6P1NDT2_9PROT|nr:folate-binding protein [Aristophania vespae]QHI95613.1 folate-binding protein [Aristophania vespae]